MYTSCSHLNSCILGLKFEIFAQCCRTNTSQRTSLEQKQKMLAPKEVTNGSITYFFVTLGLILIWWGLVYLGHMTKDSAR